jgi:NHLM bacteriocin system ABC transporter peptidase/ATP-binding protein
VTDPGAGSRARERIRTWIARVRDGLPLRRGRRVQVPTILQMEAVECGAAALAMVLAHFGRRVALEDIRVACGVSRDGSKASNIMRAARGYGLECKGYRKEPKGLRTLRPPMIIHWNFNHFVVVEGFDRKGTAFINDPAEGPRPVSEEDFDNSFTGVVLTFERARDFERSNAAVSLTAGLRRRLAGSHAALAFVILTGLALVVPGLLVPTYSRIFIDDILIHGFVDWTRPLLAIMAATLVFLAILVALQQIHLLRMETRMALATSSRFFWHVLHLPAQFFTQRYAGEIAARVGINDRVAQLLSGDLATTVLGLVTIIFYAALMLAYDGLLTSIVVLTAVFNLLALAFVHRRRSDLSKRLLQDRGKVIGTAMSGLINIESMKATGSESDFFARWSGYYTKAMNAQHELGWSAALLGLVPPLLLSISTALLLGIGGLRVMDGYMSMGMLVAFQALMLAFIAPVNGLVALGGQLHEVRGNMDRLDDVLRSPAEGLGPAAGPEAGGAPSRLSGHVELKRVSFGYSRLEPALIQDFSVTLKPGSRVALVGGSGCGKSTIARLVTGLYAPWAGVIEFDGIPRAQVPRATLLGSLCTVDQDTCLFEGTIHDNLTMWDPSVPDADLVQAARDACIHDEITARPGGYDGRVEEGGRNFSGGQRQRLEIARALVQNPSILVLDEATSALDPTIEQEIDDALRRRGCTCLIIAHRLSTIRDCDEIVVLDRGAIVQRGTHEKLRVEGVYAALAAAD